MPAAISTRGLAAAAELARYRAALYGPVAIVRPVVRSPARALGLTGREFKAHRARGGFPPPVGKVGARALYTVAEVATYAHLAATLDGAALREASVAARQRFYDGTDGRTWRLMGKGPLTRF